MQTYFNSKNALFSKLIFFDLRELTAHVKELWTAEFIMACLLPSAFSNLIAALLVST